jgi:hypothetical protein
MIPFPILQHLLSKIESPSDTESDTEDQTIESHALPHTLTNIEHIPDDFLNVLTNPTNLLSPTNPFSRNLKQNLTLKTLPVTNVTRKDIQPVSARSTPNFMNSK